MFSLLAVLSVLFVATLPSSAVQTTPSKWPLPPIPPEATVYPDLSYVTNGSGSQKLDLYLPRQGQDLPLIIYIHGGAFCMGDKRKWIGYDLGYLKDGYAIASLNYRLSNEAVFPAQIEDCKAAVRWLRAHAATFRLDSDRFVAWGASAGGNLAAMLGTTGNISQFDVGENLGYSSRVEGVADFFGPVDFTRLRPAFMGASSAESHFLGCTIEENLEKARLASPITYVTRECPPFLIVHGDADPRVSYLQSVWLAEALKTADVPVTFYIVKGAKHGGFRDPKVPLVTSAFFGKYLKATKDLTSRGSHAPTSEIQAPRLVPQPPEPAT